MNDFASQVFHRPGTGVPAALGRFPAEGNFKKDCFLYERTRHLYENKEGHAQNEAKTKLKTCCFAARIARKRQEKGFSLAKRTQETSPRALGREARRVGHGEGENRDLEKMKNRGNEAKKWLKTKDITILSGVNYARFACNFAQF